MSVRAPQMPDTTGLSPNCIPLFRELGDLKRVSSAQHEGSIASRLFLGAWGGLMTGHEARMVMQSTLVKALIATRLGDLDPAALRVMGLPPEDAFDVGCRAFDDAAQDLTHPFRDTLRASIQPTASAAMPHIGAPPACLVALTRQPRAGVTCPGRPRLLLLPQESHAEHSIMVAIYGACLADTFGSDPTEVFLAGLCHHLHNATIPDTGYSGEVLIGAHLDWLVARAFGDAIGQLSPKLAAVATGAMASIAQPGTPTAHAFHAADVIDRMLEIDQHFKLANVSMHHVLDDYGLVHAGPVKQFHDEVLRNVGLTA